MEEGKGHIGFNFLALGSGGPAGLKNNLILWGQGGGQ